MKATTLLEKQHRKVEDTLKQLESAKEDAALLLGILASDLVAHMAIEQNIFYPTVRYLKKELVLESFEEHAIAEVALKRLVATDPQDITFKAKVRTLKDLLKHHVKEEEDELFPKVEKALGDVELELLGEKMRAAFDESLRKGYDTVLPKMAVKTSADEANTPVRKDVALGNNSSVQFR